MDNTELIVERLSTMHEEMQGMRNSITQIAEAITRLAVLEDRQQGVTSTIDRLTTALEDVKTRLQKLEVAQAIRDAELRGAAWVGRGLWALVGGAVAAAAPALFRVLAG